MKNEYEVRGELTVIFLKSPKHGMMETLISTNKLERAKSFPNTWCTAWSTKGKTFYVVGKIPAGKGKQERLHRWLTKAPDGMDVDHKNLNTLDNTDQNLRVITVSENQQNRAVSRVSKTGVRGVSWREDRKKWRAQLQLNGIKKYLGHFDTIEEAERAVTEARRIHMPFSQEAH